ncbi:hypothetical protein ABE132_17280 [Peribacillus simplex]|uniref:hypothetical protein n=1 Tax=Peribacillus simplex TaxID=1478 RepID=UPI003D2B6DA0
MDYASSLIGLFAIIPILFYLGLIVLSVYFIIKIIKFINAKTRLDQERNEKLDELIKVISKDKDKDKENQNKPL